MDKIRESSKQYVKPQVGYLADDSVDAALDLEIRGLLTTCFTRPKDVVFRSRRYFAEPYPHRWVIRDGLGAMVAHVGVHDKYVEAANRTYRIGGIAEVCVHPGHRSRGYVRLMLRRIHGWLSEKGFIFAVLFGHPLVYGSSGYERATNLFTGSNATGWRQTIGLVRTLSSIPWPEGKVRLPGAKF